MVVSWCWVSLWLPTGLSPVLSCPTASSGKRGIEIETRLIDQEPALLVSPRTHAAMRGFVFAATCLVADDLQNGKRHSAG